MKKRLVYILAAVMLLAALAGCAGDKQTAQPSPSPSTAVTPGGGNAGGVGPDVDDGVVNDGDGFIEDDDTGVSPSPSARPSASPSTKPSASNAPKIG